MFRIAFRRISAMIAAISCLAFMNAAKADVVIDTFSETPVVNYQVSLLNSSPYSAPSTLLGNGLTRDITVTVLAPVPANFNSVGGSIGGGAFSFNTDNVTQAVVNLNYSGFTAATRDFSGGNSINLNFKDLNPGNVVGGGVATDMPISISIGTTTGTLTGSLNAAGGSLISVAIPFSGLSGTGDLSNVTSLSFTMNDSRLATDFELTSVTVPTSAVPAPPGLALLLAAAPVVVLRRWKAKKTA